MKFSRGMMIRADNTNKGFRGFINTLAGLVVAVSAIGCGFSPRPAQEDGQISTQQKATMRFKKLPIKYKIASSIPSEHDTEIQAAFNEWNSSTGREVFVYDGIKNLKVDELAPDYTFDENVVLMTNRSGAMPQSDGSPAAEGSGPLARTMLKGRSKIVDADIYLFEFDLNYVSGRPNTGDVYSVRSVVMHEAGHMLFGADHSDDPDSIMTSTLYPQDHPNEKLGLGASDVKKFYAVYGE